LPPTAGRTAAIEGRVDIAFAQLADPMAIHSRPAPSVARYEHHSTACIALRFRTDRGNFASARLATPLARLVFPSSSGTVYQHGFHNRRQKFAQFPQPGLKTSPALYRSRANRLGDTVSL
jgi:hypothetical protein